MQTRTLSLVEATANTAVGFIVNMGGQYIIFPVLGIAVSHAEHVWLALFFTVLSIGRGYVIRRWFNGFRFKRSTEDWQVYPPTQVNAKVSLSPQVSLTTSLTPLRPWLNYPLLGMGNTTRESHFIGTEASQETKATP